MKRLSHHVSHRTGVLVGGVAALLLYRLFATGKLGNAWNAALNGSGFPQGVTGNPSALPVAGAGGTTNNNPPSGTGSQFGLSGVTGVVHPTSYIGADQGLMPSTTAEINYLLSPGTKEAVYLPQGHWQEVKAVDPAQSMGVGGEEVWQNLDSGGFLGFLHLSDLGNRHPGDIVTGGGTGQSVGVSGWPLAPQYGIGGSYGPNNAHLAVLVDNLTKVFLGND